MKNYCQEQNIKIFHFLQPDLITKKNLTLTEKNYYNWIEEDRKNFVRENLKIFEDKIFEHENPYKNSFFITLLDIFDQFDGPIFFDKAHLSDKGNKIMSEIIADKIGEKYKMDFKEKIKEKVLNFYQKLPFNVYESPSEGSTKINQNNVFDAYQF